MTAKTFRMALGAVAAVALVIRLAYLAGLGTSPLAYWPSWDQTHMAGHRAAAARIQAGDLLLRKSPQPYQPWQQHAGTRDQWATFCAGSTWHPPGNYYVMAAFGGTSRGSLLALRSALAAAGAALCWAIGLLASRVAGKPAGIAAAALAAVYAPFVAADTVLLGDIPALLLVTLAAGVVVVPSTNERRINRLAGAGFLAGIATLFQDPAWLVAAGIAVALGVSAFRGRDGRPLAAFAAGMLIAHIPWAVRNVSLGAAPIALSCDSVARFAAGPSSPRPLASIPDSRTGAVAAAAFTRFTDPTFSVSAARATLGDVEIGEPDFPFEYSRAHSVLLFLLPRFSWIALLALAGVVTSWGSIRAGLRDSPAALLALAIGTTVFAGCLLIAPAARTRMFFVPWLLVPAAAFVAHSVKSVAARDWSAAGHCVALLLVFRLAWLAVPVDERRWREEITLNEFVAGAGMLARQGDLKGAGQEIELAWSALLARREPDAAFEMALRIRKAHMVLFFREGLLCEVEDDYENLRYALPDDPQVQEVGRALEEAKP